VLDSVPHNGDVPKGVKVLTRHEFWLTTCRIDFGAGIEHRENNITKQIHKNTFTHTPLLLTESTSSEL